MISRSLSKAGAHLISQAPAAINAWRPRQHTRIRSLVELEQGSDANFTARRLPDAGRNTIRDHIACRIRTIPTICSRDACSNAQTVRREPCRRSQGRRALVAGFRPFLFLPTDALNAAAPQPLKQVGVVHWIAMEELPELH